jgi:hypothetical protein
VGWSAELGQDLKLDVAIAADLKLDERRHRILRAERKHITFESFGIRKLILGGFK